MSYVELIEYEDVENPDVKKIYDEIYAEPDSDLVPNLFKSMAVRPDFLKANREHFRSTVLQGHMPRILKEMSGVVISQANKSEYALRVHLHGLSALGMREEVLELLMRILIIAHCHPVRKRSFASGYLPRRTLVIYRRKCMMILKRTVSVRAKSSKFWQLRIYLPGSINIQTPSTSKLMRYD
ncbi:MAG: carboxymuconolactone decarboxylase family protein [Aggregatilineales bacterium]